MYSVFWYEVLVHDVESLRNLGAEYYFGIMLQRRRFLK
jgi:hypothetical protein